MRISAREGWEGKAEEYAAGQFPRFFVFLNDRHVKDVRLADEEEGLITVLRRDANGHFVKNETNDGVLTEDLYGKVLILDIKQISTWDDNALFDVSKLDLRDWAFGLVDAEILRRGL